jgi:threonine dehydratase
MWPIVRGLADDIITVSEEEILRATKLVWERLKVAIDPSAGVGVAVAKSAKFHQKYPRLSGIENVGTILCGGGYFENVCLDEGFVSMRLLLLSNLKSFLGGESSQLAHY